MKEKYILGFWTVVAFILWMICFHGSRIVAYKIDTFFAFTLRPPEQIFRLWALNNMDCLWYYAASCVEQPIPSDVKEIYGLEGHIKDGGYFREPSYLRFIASKDFVEQLMSANTPYYGKYFSISCDHFFTVITEYRHIQDYPREFEWWQPSSVKSPTCYRERRLFLGI